MLFNPALLKGQIVETAFAKATLYVVKSDKNTKK